MGMAERDSSHLNSLHPEIHADFSYPLSLPSQPPDIRNWFSSYEYESPNSSDLPLDLASFQLPQTDDSETQEPLGVLGFCKVEESPAAKVNDFVQSLSTVPDRNFCRGISQDEFRFRDDYIQLKDSQNLLAEIERKHDDGPSGNVECNDSIAHGNSVSDQVEFSKSSNSRLKRKQNSQQELEERLIAESIGEDGNDVTADENSTKWKDENDAAQNEQLVLKWDNEKPEVVAAEDGFISTKKRENSREKGGAVPSMLVSMNHESMAAADGAKATGAHEHLMREQLQESNGTLAGRGQSQVGRRSALADRTNIQAEQGIPGKWQCPRKSKPYLGPPLKQLRLEQWVRRLN